MYAKTILSYSLEENCNFIHKARRESIVKHVSGVILGTHLTVTGIGRAVKNEATEKSNINMADRLVGNEKLHAQRESIYLAFGKALLKNSDYRPVIVVDWTSFDNLKSHMLRASLVSNSKRGMCLYEEMFVEKDWETQASHQRLLDVLAKMMPEGYKPIIVTDAGFRGPWFRAIRKLGWDFVGRIRNNTQYRLEDEEEWKECRSEHINATTKVSCLGDVILGKTTPVACQLYLYKEEVATQPSGKQCKRCRIPNCTHSKSYREPWVIASTLQEKHFKHLGQTVIKVYKKRMQIEEGFKDLKHWFSFKVTRTRCVKRLNALLLFGLLANWVAWIVGLMSEKKNLHYQYQANTTRNKRVLSVIFLGLAVIRRGRDTFTFNEFLSLKQDVSIYLDGTTQL